MKPVLVEPIDAAAFAPFGSLVAHAGGDGRDYLPLDLTAGEDLRARNWTMRLAGHPGDGLLVSTLERHPASTQAFVTLGGDGLLAVVAPTAADGGPVASGLRAFRVPPGSGVIYHRDTWHHGMVALGKGSDVFIVMGLRADGRDTVWAELSTPVPVTGLMGN